MNVESVCEFKTKKLLFFQIEIEKGCSIIKYLQFALFIKLFFYLKFRKFSNDFHGNIFISSFKRAEFKKDAK